jgi:proteic killer suppression protein
MVKQFGAATARKLQQRLAELEAAPCLKDIGALPPARCHELVGDKKGQLSVDLVHPFRLLFEPNHEPAPRKDDGGLDWERVTKITVLGVEDPH